MSRRDKTPLHIGINVRDLIGDPDTQLDDVAQELYPDGPATPQQLFEAGIIRGTDLGLDLNLEGLTSVPGGGGWTELTPGQDDMDVDPVDLQSFIECDAIV